MSGPGANAGRPHSVQSQNQAIPAGQHLRRYLLKTDRKGGVLLPDRWTTRDYDSAGQLRLSLCFTKRVLISLREGPELLEDYCLALDIR